MNLDFKQATKIYIESLLKQREFLNKEIIKIDEAIKVAESIIKEYKEANITTSSKEKVVRKRKKITEKMVRDAVIYISKNPVDRRSRFPVDEEFFTQAHVNEILGVKRFNPTVKSMLEKFVNKGILDDKAYKNGKQYRYIPHTEIKEVKIVNGDSISSRNRSVSIPGTGNNNIVIRNKDVEKMVASAGKQGFNIERLGSDHIRLSKDGKQTTISATGADRARYVENTRADLKRIGVRL